MRPEKWHDILEAAGDEVSVIIDVAQRVAEGQYGQGISASHPEVISQIAAMIQISLRQKLEAH